MGTAILRGISTGLLVTLLTLLGGVLWESMGLGGISVSSLVDIGLFLSCLIGGFRAGRDGGHWILGGAAGGGYVAVSTLLLALFSPVSGIGVVQVMAEGALLGALGGAIGGTMRVSRAGNKRGTSPREYGGYRGYRDEEYPGQPMYGHEHMDNVYRFNEEELAYGREDMNRDYDYGRLEPEHEYLGVEEEERRRNQKREYGLAPSEHEYKSVGSATHPWWEEEIKGIKRTG